MFLSGIFWSFLLETRIRFKSISLLDEEKCGIVFAVSRAENIALGGIVSCIGST